MPSQTKLCEISYFKFAVPLQLYRVSSPSDLACHIETSRYVHRVIPHPIWILENTGVSKASYPWFTICIYNIGQTVLYVTCYVIRL